MDDVVIRAQGLGKRYRIGGGLTPGGTLRSNLGRVAAAPFSHLRSLLRTATEAETVWALRDVSFEVRQGDVLGVIGRNGAGKSTLLKVLARITEPTTGRVEMRGRVASLLEVGTGFHPELTGRENVFLNGAILGMRRSETEAKFEDIVTFAGVERFLDTPVKRYSTGMSLRLAFAVAAQLDADILLIDEVLAVGDAAFQQKCVGKLEEVAGSGRTVLFVSHQMPAVSKLCNRALLLDQGRLVDNGPVGRIVATYLNDGLGHAAERAWDATDAPGDDVARLRRVRVLDRAGPLLGTLDARDEVGIELEFEVLDDRVPVTPMLAVRDDKGVLVFNAVDPDAQWQQRPAVGRYRSTAWIPGNFFNDGTLVVSAFVNTVSPGKTIKHAHAPDAVAFHVAVPSAPDSAKGPFGGSWGGPVAPRLRWEATRPAEPPTLEDPA